MVIIKKTQYIASFEKNTVNKRNKMDNSRKEIASKRLRDLRKIHNYTMEQLAEIIGVSKSTIAKWEKMRYNGYKIFDFTIIALILCKALRLVGK